MDIQKDIVVSKVSIITLRIMLSGIFIIASLNHIFKIEHAVNKINQSHFKNLAYIFGEPSFSIIASGIVMLIAGIMLLIGFKTKYAAITLVIILIPITLTIQVGQMSTIGPLFKNIAIMGALIFFIINNINTQKNEDN